MPALSLLDRLADLPDPRGRHGRVSPPVPLVALGLVAILAGHTSVAAIAQLGRLRGKRLGPALGVPHGKMPRPTTLTNRLAALDADALDRLSGQWLQGRHAAGRGHAALDGKVLEGRRDGAVPGGHLLAAYAPQAPAVIARLRVEATTNEHEAALRLLGALPPPAGAAVTADAMFSHADVCAAVLTQGGDCVLYAKDNRATRQADLEAVSGAAGSGGFSPRNRSTGGRTSRSPRASGRGTGGSSGGRSSPPRG